VRRRPTDWQRSPVVAKETYRCADACPRERVGACEWREYLGQLYVFDRGNTVGLEPPQLCQPPVSARQRSGGGLISFARRAGKEESARARAHSSTPSTRHHRPRPLRRSLSRCRSSMHLSVSLLLRLLRIDLQQVKAVSVCVCVVCVCCVCMLCVLCVCVCVCVFESVH
jgi:hypothetical protein